MACVVDLEDEAPAPAQPRPEDLRAALEKHLTGRDLSALSLKGLRRELEQLLGFREGGLDSRKDEIKTFAGAFAQAQLAAPKPAAALSPPKTEGPPAKRKRGGLTQTVDGVTVIGGRPVEKLMPLMPPPPEPPVKAKKKAVISAYSLWGNDNRARLTEELAASRGGEKPSFGEMCKAVSEGWKQVSAEVRAEYEQKATQAKAEAAAAEPKEPAAAASKGPKAPKPAGQAKPSKGKGKGKDPNSSVSLTRAEFLRAAKTLRCSVHLDDGTQDGSAPLSSFTLKPRLFKSGGAGWFQFADIDLPIGDQQLRIKAQLNVLVPSSKHWEDGEGLAEAMAGTPAAEASEAEGGEAAAAAEPAEAAAASAEAEADAPAQTEG